LIDEESPPARPWLAPSVVAVVTALVFTPALWNEFAWDDETMLRQNPSYRGLGWREISWMLTTVHMTHYSPLSWITLGLDHVLWGMTPAGYHATSVVLHVITAGLFCLVAARLLEMAMAGAPDRSTPAVQVGAALAGLLFSVHPLRVESVVWVTERRDVLCGLFYVAAVLAYLRMVEAEAAGTQRRRRRLVPCLALFTLALLSKSMAVTLPLVLLILDVYPLRRLGGAVGWLTAAAWPVWREKTPFLVLSLVGGAVQIVALIVSGNVATVVRPGATGRVAIAVYDLALYLLKTGLPFGLSPLYELFPSPNFLGWPFIASGVVVLAITGLAVMQRGRWPALAAIWAGYVVILLPVLGTANTFQIAADRYTYLAGLGWALLGGFALAHAGRERLDVPFGDVAQGRLAVSGLAIAVLAGLVTLTVYQIHVWRDAEALWSHAISLDRRSTVAHYNLGVVRVGQGRLGDAVDHFTKTVDGRPSHADAHNNLGLALIRLGRPGEAVEPLRQALQLRPDFAFAHNNLGLALMRSGQRVAAEAEFIAALDTAPDLVSARVNLGALLLAAGRPAEALVHLERAATIDPSVSGLAEAREQARAASGPAPRR
jgi:tetratricopeptide (TPR) repeat protein